MLMQTETVPKLLIKAGKLLLKWAQEDEERHRTQGFLKS